MKRLIWALVGSALVIASMVACDRKSQKSQPVAVNAASSEAKAVAISQDLSKDAIYLVHSDRLSQMKKNSKIEICGEVRPSEPDAIVIDGKRLLGLSPIL